MFADNDGRSRGTSGLRLRTQKDEGVVTIESFLATEGNRLDATSVVVPPKQTETIKLKSSTLPLESRLPMPSLLCFSPEEKACAYLGNGRGLSLSVLLRWPNFAVRTGGREIENFVSKNVNM